MTYAKPVIVITRPIIAEIQGTAKGGLFFEMASHPNDTVAAYEANE